MAEEGYGYCPVCQAVMPNRHAVGLNQDVIFQRILSHIKTHSFWEQYLALRRIRKEEKLRSKSS